MLSINLFYISMVIHILSAITWLGSLIALEFIIVPSFIKNFSSVEGKLVGTVSTKFTAIVQISSILILLSGVYQTFAIGFFDIEKLFFTVYGNLIVIKVILYVVFAFIGIRTAMNLSKIDAFISKEDLVKLLEKSKQFLYLDLFIGIVIILIAVSLVINV